MSESGYSISLVLARWMLSTAALSSSRVEVAVVLDLVRKLFLRVREDVGKWADWRSEALIRRTYASEGGYLHMSLCTSESYSNNAFKPPALAAYSGGIGVGTKPVGFACLSSMTCKQEKHLAGCVALWGALRKQPRMWIPCRSSVLAVWVIQKIGER